MKYARLTKEQLDSLQQEFINFLATQTITAQEWQTIKKEQPQVAEQELDVFSDLVWEGALSQAKFLENISPKLLFLFKLEAQQMSLISVKVVLEGIDITTKEGYSWLQKNYATDGVEFYAATKEYTEDKNLFGILEVSKSWIKHCTSLSAPVPSIKMFAFSYAFDII